MIDSGLEGAKIGQLAKLTYEGQRLSRGDAVQVTLDIEAYCPKAG